MAAAAGRGMQGSYQQHERTEMIPNARIGTCGNCWDRGRSEAHAHVSAKTGDPLPPSICCLLAYQCSMQYHGGMVARAQ